MNCSRRLYKGTPYPYEIELPFSGSNITDLTVTFYTDGELTVTKDLTDITLSGDTMVITLEPEDLEYLADGVLYYTVEYDGDEYGEYSTNSPFVVATPGDYSGSTLEELLAASYDSGYSEGWPSGYISGYTVGQEDCSGGTCESAWTEGYQSGYTDGLNACDGEDYSTSLLRFEIISGGTIKWSVISNGDPKTIQVKIDEGGWSSITSTLEGVVLNVNPGNTVWLKGNNSQYFTNTFDGSTAVYVIKGNIMSLINGDNISAYPRLTSESTFRKMFQGTNVVDASDMVLPAQIITKGCYQNLFKDCTLLLYPPKELPALVVPTLAYADMFMGCSIMKRAPKICATSFRDSSEIYRMSMNHMFAGCENLTVGPDLLFDKTYDEHCEGMFSGCTNLRYLKCLATHNDWRNAYPNWLDGVSPTGTFVKAPEATVSNFVSGDYTWCQVDPDFGSARFQPLIPVGWTVIDNT